LVSASASLLLRSLDAHLDRPTSTFKQARKQERAVPFLPMLSSSADVVSLLPPLWALSLATGEGVKAIRRRWSGQIRLQEDEGAGIDQQKPLFAVFVEDEDILAAQGVEAAPVDTSTGYESAGEAALPPRPFAIVFIPAFETLACSAVLLYAVLEQEQEAQRFPNLLFAAGRALAWVRGFPSSFPLDAHLNAPFFLRSYSSTLSSPSYAGTRAPHLFLFSPST
jgi:hypothetical protein